MKETDRVKFCPEASSSMPTPSKSLPNVKQIRLARAGVKLGFAAKVLREFRRHPQDNCWLQIAPASPSTINHDEAAPHQAGGDIKIEVSSLLSHDNNNYSPCELLLLHNEKTSHLISCNLLLLTLTLLLLLQLQLVHTTNGQLAQPLDQVSFNGPAHPFPQHSAQLPTFFPPEPHLTSHAHPSVRKSRWTGARGVTNLEAPPSMHQQYSQGPGLDLVALNRRRFELNHQHNSGGSSEKDMERGALIESYLAGVPDQLLAALPENMDRQILETLAADPSLLAGESAGSRLTDVAIDEPDDASIERLTKNCLSVHASSSSPEQLNVTFHLYTKNNPHSPFVIRPQITRQELIKSSPLDPSRPIKWITHGFHTNVDKSEWMVETKNKILAFEDSNVILTDWRRGASPTLAFYPKAAANAHVVAKMIVKILRRLRKDINFLRIHLIGHSLGAHIMGFVGSAFTEEYLYQRQRLLATAGENGADGRAAFWRDSLTLMSNDAHKSHIIGSADQLIGRITACDPALPCFGPTSSAAGTGGGLAGAASPSAAAYAYAVANASAISTLGARNSALADTNDWTPSSWTHLRPDSAVVVEVIHSNPGVMGYAEPLGDYDFYPNGLQRQPGCGGSLQQEAGGGTQFMAISGGSRSRRQLIPGFMKSLFGGGRLAQSQGEPSRLTSTLDRFIKPIRDFFTGYICSHHRSVEYMVESMYYERVPQDRKLDRDFVCQMVGYRCKDYASFKRGFCFKCTNELDCRAFTMSVGPMASSDWGQQMGTEAASSAQIIESRSSSAPRSLQTPQAATHLNKFKVASSIDPSNNGGQLPQHQTKNTQSPFKRVLPTFNQYGQNYLPLKKNLYFFDTRSSKEYCTHHYHLYVKYRWFRVRDSIIIDGFRLLGTLANVTLLEAVTLNRFTYQSYTMLLTEPAFLGQMESLVLLGDKIKAIFVEYIEITYMSNLDPRVRALGSARLCRQTTRDSVGLDGNFVSSDFGSNDNSKPQSASLFVRCSGSIVV